MSEQDLACVGIFGRSRHALCAGCRYVFECSECLETKLLHLSECSLYLLDSNLQVSDKILTVYHIKLNSSTSCP